jgi:NlpC/P60 family/Bacterial dipeptidyl-peptidase Sh3 domain
MTLFDKRLHAYRDDLADVRLKNDIKADSYVAGEEAQCFAPIAGVHKAPSVDAMQTTQVLMGERLRVFERKAGWAWVQLRDDSYVGYVRESALLEGNRETTDRITTPLAHLFPRPDLKSTPAILVPMNAGLSVMGRSGDYLEHASGQFVYAAHCAVIDTRDFVSVAERFLHTPYLWGGKTALGIDCSGLVQVAMQACGLSCPRDSDMQEKDLGADVPREQLQRGDLVFWKGHVGLMQDEHRLLHANGHHLMVVSELLKDAIARISAKGSEITSIKRIQ